MWMRAVENITTIIHKNGFSVCIWKQHVALFVSKASEKLTCTH